MYYKCNNKFCEYSGMFDSEDKLKEHQNIHDWHRVGKYDVFDRGYAAIRYIDSLDTYVTDLKGVTSLQQLDKVFGYIVFENQVMTSVYNAKCSTDYTSVSVLESKFNKDIVSVVLKKLKFKSKDVTIDYYQNNGLYLMHIYKTGENKDAIVCQAC